MPRLSAPGLSAASRGIIHAQACARIDLKDRPADCPPNRELLAILAAERGPKYRPENVQGFSRGEIMARDIPPPCLDNGENARFGGGKLCVMFGRIPARVKTPQELCEIQGIGPCVPPPAAAVAAARAMTNGP